MSDFYEDMQFCKGCFQIDFDLKERQIHTLKSLYNGHNTEVKSSSFPTFKARNGCHHYCRVHETFEKFQVRILTSQSLGIFLACDGKRRGDPIESVL